MRQSEIAQAKSAINPRIILAQDYEDHFASEVSSAERIAETVEVFREDTGASVITFHEKIEPSKPKVRRNRTATERDNASDKKTVAERARAGRLLGSLAKLYATRSQPLFRSRHRIALLTIAGNLLAIVAAHDGREFEPANLHRWARKNVDGATQAEIEQAFEAALQEYRAVLAPSAVGFALGLGKEHWFRAGRPWGVHPADLKAEDVEKVQRAAKRARDRQRAAAQRAASGSTPRSASVSEIARKLGISRPTLYKRMRAAGFDNAADFYKNVASTSNKKYTRDAFVNAPPTTQHQLAGGSKAAAAEKPNQSLASGKSPKAAIRREPPAPATANEGSQGAPSLTRVASDLRAIPSHASATSGRPRADSFAQSLRETSCVPAARQGSAKVLSGVMAARLGAQRLADGIRTLHARGGA